MRIISLEAVRGDETLAKDILTSSDSLLLPAGTMMKKEYVKRLKELNIEYIYVEDDLSQGVNLTNSLEFQIKEQCQDAVRDLLIKYSYNEEGELEDIKMVADEIIHDIMDEPEVIYNLSTIRDKSDITYSHTLNVCALSVILAFKLKLQRQKIREIAIGSLLHDIGLTYISPEYYGINLDNCDEKERKEIKKHIIYGYSAIEKMDWLSATAKDIIISHHERLNGSGYPFHIKEDRIKIGSRIVAVCDEFDSRVYGNFITKMKVHVAIDYIVSQVGVLFDLAVVKAFVDSVAAYPCGSLVRTNEGEVGIVLRQNPQCPTRPVIRIIEDQEGKKPEQWVEKNLTKELTLFITEVLDA